MTAVFLKFIQLSQNWFISAAIWARVTSPFGTSVFAVMPLMVPVSTAHCMASFAQPDTWLASVNGFSAEALPVQSPTREA